MTENLHQRATLLRASMMGNSVIHSSEEAKQCNRKQDCLMTTEHSDHTITWFLQIHLPISSDLVVCRSKDIKIVSKDVFFLRHLIYRLNFKA